MASDPYQNETVIPLPGTSQAAVQGGKLSAAARAQGPGSDPGVTAKIALGSASPTDAATNSVAANALLQSGDTATKLMAQSTNVQESIWNNLTPQHQRMLKTAGYEPPDANQQSGTTPAKPGGLGGLISGAIHHVTNDVSNDILKPAERDVLQPALGNRPVHDVLNALGAPLRAVQHVERAGFLVSSKNEQGNPVGLFSTQNSEYSAGLGQLFSPHAWAKAWRETSNGEKFIQPTVEKEVQRKYGHEIYQLAHQVATGDTVEQVVKGLPANQQANAMKLLQSTKGQQAVSDLNDGHITVGQSIVGANNLMKNSHLHMASGAIDGVFDWYGDPTNSGLKLTKGLTDLRRLAATGNDMERVASNSEVRRGLDQIGTLVKNNDAVGFSQQFPQYQGIWPALTESGARADTGEKVLEKFKGIANTKYLMSLPKGEVPGIEKGGIVMPTLTRAGQVRTAIRNQLEKVEGWGDLAEAKVQGVKASELTNGITSPVAHTAGMMHIPTSIATHVGSAFRKFSTYIPAAINHGEVDMGNVASMNRYIEQIYNAAKLSLPIARAKELTNSLAEMMQSDPGLLKTAVTNFTKEIYLAAGVPDGSEDLKLAMSRLDSSMMGEDLKDGSGSLDGQAYAPGQIGWMEDKAGKSTAALFENQMSDVKFELPDFQLVHDAVKKGAVGKMMGLIDKGVGPVMNIWRPAVLMRPAFGTRVAADEGLIGALRVGPAKLAKARLLASGLRATTKLTPMDVEDLEDSGLFRRWFGEMSQDQLDELRSSYSKKVWKFDELPRTERKAEVDNLRALGEAKPNLSLRELGDKKISQMTNRELAQAARVKMGESASGISHAWYRTMYRRAVANLGAAATSDDERRWLQDYVKYQGHNSFLKHVSTIEGDQSGYIGSAIGARRAQSLVGGGKDMRLLPADLRPTGRYVQLSNGDFTFNRSLQKYYESIAHSEWGQEAARSADREAVADKMQGSEVWNRMAVRAKKLSTGERVDLGEATSRQAALDHADKVISAVKAVTEGPDGTELSDVRDMLGRGEVPSAERIRQMQDEGQVPAQVSGPEMVHVLNTKSPGVFQRFNDWQWNHVIGSQIDWMVREPLYIHEYLTARAAYDGFARSAAEHAGGSDQAIENWELNAHRAATASAFRNIDPYVHNPELKTQFAAITRNLAPFYFAQQQFFRRWALSIAASPWSLRQIQLVNGGIQHNGFVHQETNANGQTENYFVYPGSKLLQGEIGRVVGLLTGQGNLPVPGQLTGSPNTLMAGQDLELPSGPLTTLSLKALGKLDPALAGMTNDLEGGAASSENMLQAILPSDIYRALSAAAPESFDPSAYASAQMQAIQYLEATGHGLATPALNNKGTLSGVETPEEAFPDHSGLSAGDYVTDDQGREWVYTDSGHWQQTTAANEARQMQQYIYRVNAWTKSFLGMRAVMGLIVPSSPGTQIGGQVGTGNGLYQKFEQYTNSMPIDQALAAFVKNNPDAQPYEVFGDNNTGAVGSYNNQAAQNWIDQNSSFVNSHSEAALYFLPLSDTVNQQYSSQVQQRQVAMGLRTKDNPTQFWQQMAYQEAAEPFFNAEDQRNALLKQNANNSQAQQQIYNQWDTFQQSYLAANPIFEQQYLDDSGPTNRIQLMTDVKNALDSPDVPKTQQSEDIGNLYNAWSQWQSILHGPGGDGVTSLSSAEKTSVDQQFADWAYEYIQEHPDTSMLYNKAIRPDLSSVLDPTNYMPLNMESAQLSGAADATTTQPASLG